MFLNLKKCLSSPNQFLKLLVVLGCLCFSIYQVAQCVFKLLKPPITTYYGFHLNESMTYPSVTICRRPGFKDESLIKFGLRARQALTTHNAFLSFNFSMYTIQEFLKETTYKYKSFETISSGKCFTFNPLVTSNEYSMSGGWFFFLKHDMTVRQPDAYGQNEDGFHVYVHDSNEIMNSDDGQDDNFLEYVYLEAWEEMRIHFKHQEFFRVNTNENPCIDHADQPTYSRSRCIEECLHRRIAKIINCTLPWLWLLAEDSYPQCDNFEDVNKLISFFLAHNRKELVANCSCLRSCHVTIYNPTIIRRNDGAENNYPNSALGMYYTNNLVTEMREVVGYSFNTFISDIGGSLGFLLGLSVVGLIKVLEKIICEIIKNYYTKKKKHEDGGHSETYSNCSSSTKMADDESLKRNVGLYENLRDFESDDFKHYQKTLIAQSDRF
ncbi:hypothetical protein ABEB36_009050 [Hypothenemus hampei]|uniref:Uncharacterized protein n=1 Tax=Hypothenemus hampei TaxID=57062 RepID=A0ABD1EPD7_HYPHA